VLDALIETSTRGDALERLMAGDTLADEVERNAMLWELPTRKAIDTYTGVVFDALDAASLEASAKRRLSGRLVITSGLWGAIRPNDRIPAYRLNICSRLVGLDRLEPLWRQQVPDVLAGAAGRRGVIVDARSSSYLAFGPPTGLGDRTATVRVVRSVGDRSAPAYVAKQTRGYVTRYLLESRSDPSNPADLADVVSERWQVALVEPKTSTKPWTLEVVAD
jgi:cytoplasmic iron level regulating protein YaaA (DUF328/UPF0246 family)